MKKQSRGPDKESERAKVGESKREGEEKGRHIHKERKMDRGRDEWKE